MGNIRKHAALGGAAAMLALLLVTSPFLTMIPLWASWPLVIGYIWMAAWMGLHLDGFLTDVLARIFGP